MANESWLHSDVVARGGHDGNGDRPRLVVRAGRWLAVGQRDAGLFPPFVRRLGGLWVCVSLPSIAVMSGFARTPGAYVFVLIFLACGAYTAPALVANGFVIARVSGPDRRGYLMIYVGLIVIFVIGVGMLIGLATGWTFANEAGVPAVLVSSLAHMVGLALILRSRSGRRALAVDVIEAAGTVVAVTAPLVVLWGPTIGQAEASWFTIPCALILVPMVWGTYWTVMLFVRMGPDRGALELSAVVLAMAGILNVALQTVQGVSGFTLPAPPLVAITSVCASMYLLMPLHLPMLAPPGLSRLSPQAQVRGGWVATSVALTGTVVLLLATAVVADERPWTVPFSLGVVTVLLILGGLRQIAGDRETRRLYRQVEEASDERRRLVTQLLERSVHDRRRFAGQLHEQAVAASASFAALAASGQSTRGRTSVVTQASSMVQQDLARHADSLRDLLLTIRPLESDKVGGERLQTPIAAYLASAYGDGRAPRLTVSVDEAIVLDWVTETVLLQIVQEALHNVWRHSGARAVDVVIERAGAVTVVRVADDGIGFDPESVTEESGIAAMRASAAVLGGTLAVTARRGEGTAVTVSLGAAPEEPPPLMAPVPTPSLRIVRDH